MKSFICALVVVLSATPVFAQFGDRLRPTPPASDDTKPENKSADPIPADPNANPPGAQADASDALFAALDTDGDGTISKTELKKAITALKKLDADNDGNITRAECSLGAAVAGGPAAANSNASAEATQWMDRILAKDKNKDGKLAPNELNDNEKQMLQNADANNDGFIDRTELQLFVNNQNAMNAAAGALNGLGNAGPGGRGGNNDAMGFFLRYDANGDGKLSPNELPPQMARSMSAADLNHDNFIDAREFQAFGAKMGDRMRMMGAGLDPNNPANGRGRKP